MKKAYLKNYFLKGTLKVLFLCLLALSIMVFLGKSGIIQAGDKCCGKEGIILTGELCQRKDFSRALEQEKSYRIYADKDIAEVLETVAVYWEENDSALVYLIAEYEGKPVWKMEVEEGLNSINLAFDREGRWELYFLIRESGGIRSAKGEEGSLELLIAKEDEIFSELNIKTMKYGKEMVYFKWNEEFDGVKISVSDKKYGTYKELGEIEGKGFWLKAGKVRYIKLCPYILLNDNKYYGQSKVTKLPD